MLSDPRADPHLKPEKTWLGPWGLLMFVYGLVDLVIDVLFCASLWQCDQYVLFACGIATNVVTAGMTWYLGGRTLRSIVVNDRREGSPAKSWLSDNQILGPLIVLASTSRLNSMAILRLKICGRPLLSFDDSDNHRYFHFMRNSGMFHYLVEDVPHALMSLAVIFADDLGIDMKSCADNSMDKIFGCALNIQPQPKID
jgi:hypothetical protein